MKRLISGVLLAVTVAVPAASAATSLSSLGDGVPGYLPVDTPALYQCLALTPSAVSVPIGEAANVLDLLVVIDVNVTSQLDAGKQAQITGGVFDRVATSYSAAGIEVSATFMTHDFGTQKNASSLIQATKALFGGQRPPGTDIVYTITGKDIEDGVNGSSVAGLADCIGGVEYPDHAFAVGEAKYLGSKAIFSNRFTEKVAAHEIGHLMGAHHHYANCVEGVTVDDVTESDFVSPCTLMFNAVDFQSLNFSVLNRAVVRGHADHFLH